MQCRKLVQDDAASIATLEQACFSLPWSQKQILSALTQKSFAAFGLFDETLIAYISFYHVVDEIEILNLAVEPSRRRLGYGRLLLTTCLQTGQKMGIHKVRLEVREHNTAALALYRSCGFVQEGVRVRYYSDTGEDALILAHSITSL